jgi:F-type H+-transporting ATPase subunit b
LSETLMDPSALLFALSEPAGGGWWARVAPYLDYPGFEVWKFFNLGLFVILMAWILLRKADLPLAFRTRRESIRTELDKARKERDEALAKLKEVEERIAGLSDQISSIKENSQREAAEERRRITLSTEEEISKLTEQAQRDIENAGRTAKNELRRYTAEQSVRLAEDILKREMRPEDDTRLIARNIEEMGAAR